MSFRFRMVDQPLAVQFWGAGGIVALLSLVSVVLILTQVRHQTNASRFLERTQQTIDRLNTVDRALFEQHRALMSYTQGRRKADLSRFEKAVQLWETRFVELKANPASALAPASFVAELRGRYDTWYGLARTILRNAEHAPSRELELESGIFGELTALIGGRIEEAELTVTRRADLEKAAIQKTFAAVTLVELGLLLIFGIVLTQLYHSIARQISELQKAMTRYQEGDFQTRVPVANRSQVGLLQKHFNDLAGNIEAMVGDLRKLDQMKSEFISTVSHELRTPLTAIGGYVKIIAAGDAGPINDTQKEFLEILNVNVDRLSRLINDVLDIESMETGRARMERNREDLSAVLKECRDTLGVLASQKGLELRYDVPPSLRPVLGDHARLVQIFTNLISNAIKYTPKGSVAIEAEEKDFAVVVRVKDTGVGLTPQEQERLFDKFYRTRSGIDSGESGSGLGLAIARSLVEAHGGTIRLESAPGKGTTFTVTLPTIAANRGLQSSSSSSDSAGAAP